MLALCCLLLTCMVGCGGDATTDPNNPQPFVDYVGQTKLDMNSNTLKQEVTVKGYVDGDTTHFYVPTDIRDTVKGFTAVIFQHETDHLDGILYTDRL